MPELKFTFARELPETLPPGQYYWLDPSYLLDDLWQEEILSQVEDSGNQLIQIQFPDYLKLYPKLKAFCLIFNLDPNQEWCRYMLSLYDGQYPIGEIPSDSGYLSLVNSTMLECLGKEQMIQDLLEGNAAFGLNLTEEQDLEYLPDKKVTLGEHCVNFQPKQRPKASSRKPSLWNLMKTDLNQRPEEFSDSDDGSDDGSYQGDDIDLNLPEESEDEGEYDEPDLTEEEMNPHENQYSPLPPEAYQNPIYHRIHPLLECCDSDWTMEYWVCSEDCHLETARKSSSQIGGHRFPICSQIGGHRYPIVEDEVFLDDDDEDYSDLPPLVLA